MAASATREQTLGFVQGATAGSRVLALDEVPATVRHATEIALAEASVSKRSVVRPCL